MKKTRLKAQNIGLALGSGGARGFAHIGVIHALKEAGIAIGAVAGTSMGSLVGAFLAADRMAALRQVVLRLDWRALSRYSSLSLSGGGLLEGKALHRELLKLLGAKFFSDLHIPYCAIATDLRSGEEIHLTQGNLATAIRASCCIPGLFVPVEWESRWLVDGSLLNPVPVNIARQLEADYVIAVDVTPSPELPLSPTPAEIQTADDISISAFWQEVNEAWNEPLADQPRINQWLGRIQKTMDLVEDYSHDLLARPRAKRSPPLTEVLTQSIRITETRIAQERLLTEPPDLLIRPDVGMYGSLDFARAPEIMMAGYLATRNALAKLKHVP